MAQSRSNVARAVRGSRPGSGLYNAAAVPGGGASHIGGSTAVAPSTHAGLNKPGGFNKEWGAFKNSQQVTNGTNVPPGASAPSPSPWDTDPISQGQIAGAKTGYENALGYDASNRVSVVNHYGYETTYYNPLTGQTETIKPVYSPYSLASLLQRSHEINRRGAVNSAGLNLYAGSTTNHLNQADRRFGQEEAQQKESFAQEQAKIGRQEQEAQEGREEKENSAKEGAVGRAAEEPLPETPEPGGGNSLPGLGGDPAHPKAYRAGVGAGKEKPKAPAGYHAYKGPGNQWWFAPN